jgi:hypothetical protein
MVLAYNLKLTGSLFAQSRQLPQPVNPRIAFYPDMETAQDICENLFSPL